MIIIDRDPIMGWAVRVLLDVHGLRTHSKLNQRVHWAAKARETKDERDATWIAWQTSGILAVDLPAQVLLTRIGPRELDDDNLQGALKAVRDQVAAGMGVDDSDPLVEWTYDQESGPYGVRVTITSETCDWAKWEEDAHAQA